MSEAISIGDLVIVVRWEHKHRELALGKIYTVISIDSGSVICGDCFALIAGPMAQLERPGRTGWAPLHWLRRIPPLSELETAEHKEELPACAHLAAIRSHKKRKG